MGSTGGVATREGAAFSVLAEVGNEAEDPFQVLLLLVALLLLVVAAWLLELPCELMVVIMREAAVHEEENEQFQNNVRPKSTILFIARPLGI
jgi:heme/copper-type cytochrome/quinol oxidase subunit 2